MKTNRQARLLLMFLDDQHTHEINISNHKRQYYHPILGVYCIDRKLNIGQARWARYRRLVKLLGTEEV